MQAAAFFIVGAPKCGTTALAQWLGAHPQVCMSRPKEPQFFAEDIFGHQRNVTDLDRYLRCFESSGQPKHLGEASTCYLASPSAAERIKAFSPQAKIIVMLRDPVEVMYSLHSERVFSNMEQIRDFALALDAESDRIWTAGRFRGERVMRPSYRRMVRFSEQLRRYFGVFSRDEVHVVVYDDLLRSAAKVYAGALDFLGLDDDGRNDFAAMNANKYARSLPLQGFIDDPASRLRHVGRLLLPKMARSYIARAVSRLNTVEEPRPAMNFDLRERLVREFEPEVAELSSILERDLSTWSKA
jgi:hypothetical protein